MATLFFRVYETAAEVAAGPKVNEGAVTISGTAAQSGVMHSTGGNKSRRVRLFADTACFVTWGSNPTALIDGTEGMPLGAENPEYIHINSNEKLSVIARTLP